MNYYAHSLEGQPKEQWQPLDEHLRNVAELAAEFAKPFGGEDWAWIAGLWHDLGSPPSRGRGLKRGLCGHVLGYIRRGM